MMLYRLSAIDTLVSLIYNDITIPEHGLADPDRDGPVHPEGLNLKGFVLKGG